MIVRHRLPPEPLGWGDYDYPDRRITKHKGRKLFLNAIAERRPNVLADLARSPLETFRSSSMVSNDFRRLDLREHLLTSGVDNDWYQHDPAHDATVEALRTWGERWNLTTPWCLAHALETLGRWARQPEVAGRRWEYVAYIGSGLRPTDTIFTLHVENLGWEPSLSSWDEYRETVLVEIAQYLVTYRRRIEQVAEASGMTRVEQKAPAHFVWLAIYQTSDLGYAAMLNEAHQVQPSLSERGLYNALTSTARTIELPLRQSVQKGRKPGTLDRGRRRHIVRHARNTHT